MKFLPYLLGLCLFSSVKNISCLLVLHRGECVGWTCGDAVLGLGPFPPEAGMCYTHPVISACSGPLVEEDSSLPAYLK